MISTPFLYNNKAFEMNNEEKNNNTIDNDDIILNYKINKIQEEINSIKEKNESLLKNLSNEQERNIQLKSSSKDIEKILMEISKYFEVNNSEEIPAKLSEMINFLSDFNNINENEAKNELKIKDLKDKIKKLIKYIKKQKTFAKEVENEYAIQICNQALQILGDKENE